MIPHKPHKGTSAPHTVYSLFFQQRSDLNHAKEQAPYTLYASFYNKNPTSATWRKKRAAHCVCLKQRSDLTTQRNKRPTHCVCLALQAKIRHKTREGTRALRTVYASFYKQTSNKPREGTSALCTVYASFFQQSSDISHVKEKAFYMLYIHCTKIFGGMETSKFRT